MAEEKKKPAAVVAPPCARAVGLRKVSDSPPRYEVHVLKDGKWERKTGPMKPDHHLETQVEVNVVMYLTPPEAE